MALSCNETPASMPPYFIYRDIPDGEPFDPTVPPTFWPPKDSDELFDALRAKFPHLKTHSERMRDAIIEFMLEERQAEHFQSAAPSTVSLNSIPTTAYASTGMHSHSGSSVLSSPELLSFTTPASFENSPMSAMSWQQHAARQPSISTSSGQPSPPSLDQMTGVFSLSAGPQPKQRVRRKMTEAEKVEYRKRRIVKACEKCARRKRKCHHNQPEMESVGPPHSSTLGHKVAKSFASASSAKSLPTTTPPVPQQQTESFLGHFFVDADAAAAMAYLPELPDFDLAQDTPTFADIYPSIDIDDLFYPDVFQAEESHAPQAWRAGSEPLTTPQHQAWANTQLPGAVRGNEYTLPAWLGPDETYTAVEGSAANCRNAPSFVDNVSLALPQGAFGALAGETASTCLFNTSPSPSQHLGDQPVSAHPRANSIESRVPTHAAIYRNESCLGTGVDSHGASATSSSTHDAVMRPLLPDQQGPERKSDATPCTSRINYRITSGPAFDRSSRSAPVAVDDGTPNNVPPLQNADNAPCSVADIKSARRTSIRKSHTSKPRTPVAGIGLLENVDPAMQLFKLRRRISTSRNSSINAQLTALARRPTNARLQVIPDASASASADSMQRGTAGLCYETIPHGQPSPVHTRPTKPSSSGSTGGTGQHHVQRFAVGPAGSLWLDKLSLRDMFTKQGKNYEQVHRLRNSSYLKECKVGDAQSGNVGASALLPPCLDVALSSLLVAAVVCTLFTSLLPQQGPSSSWALLGLCALAGEKVSLRAAKYIPRQHSLFDKDGLSWLHGLMYPFMLAPLRFIS